MPPLFCPLLQGRVSIPYRLHTNIVDINTTGYINEFQYLIGFIQTLSSPTQPSGTKAVSIPYRLHTNLGQITVIHFSRNVSIPYRLHTNPSFKTIHFQITMGFLSAQYIIQKQKFSVNLRSCKKAWRSTDTIKSEILAI